MTANIQIIEPWWDELNDQGKEYIDAFWQEVAEDPACVVIVQILQTQNSAELSDVAVFSNRAEALAYARACEGAGATIIPKRVNEPSWGNTEVN